MSDAVHIEKALADLLALKEKMLDAKVILRSFKMQSEQLSQLKNAYKDLKMQIDEEKKRIESEFLEDMDYEQAKKDEMKYKEEMREKAAELRELLSKMNKSEDLVSLEYNINNEPLHVQVERVTKVYLNGTEQR